MPKGVKLIPENLPIFSGSSCRGGGDVCSGLVRMRDTPGLATYPIRAYFSRDPLHDAAVSKNRHGRGCLGWGRVAGWEDGDRMSWMEGASARASARDG